MTGSLAGYVASPIKRHRSTKAQVEERRQYLFLIVEMAPSAEIHFERIAVEPDQIAEWNLPTRPTKQSDSRAKAFGDVSVELDAIEPQRLRDLVEAAINRHLPADQLRVLQAAEESERNMLKAFALDAWAGDADG